MAKMFGWVRDMWYRRQASEPKRRTTIFVHQDGKVWCCTETLVRLRTGYNWVTVAVYPVHFVGPFIWDGRWDARLTADLLSVYAW